MGSSSPHQRFFSSLDLVEKRMASESAKKSLPEANPIPFSSSSDDQLRSPLYLLSTNPVPLSGTSSSGPPLDFLSNASPQEQRSSDDGDGDEIEQLIELLGEEEINLKRGKEESRLDGWIEYYRKERKEPARLAHLLLGKAVSFSGDVVFAGIGFPSTVCDFLRNDPPTR